MLSIPASLPPRSVKFPVEPNSQKPPSSKPRPASIPKYEYLAFASDAFNLNKVV